MAKKKQTAARVMQFYNLKLNRQDLDHLRWVLSMHSDIQQDLMDSPPTKGQTPEEQLEDWVIARDLKANCLKVIQMIDRVCPGLNKEA